MDKKLNWLLLRGLTREARHWGEFKNQFAKQSSVGSVATLDLPGVGTELNRASPHNIDKIVDDLRSRFKPTPGQWGILGLSLGGMIALRWSEKYPNDFSCAVIINSSAKNLSPLHRRFKLMSLIKIAKGIFGRDPEKLLRAILSLTSNLKNDDPNTLDLWRKITIESSPSNRVLLAQMWAAYNFSAPNSLNLPLLFLTSSLDKIVSFHCSEALAKFYSAPLGVNPQSGHELTLDDPSWVLQKIGYFLKSLD